MPWTLVTLIKNPSNFAMPFLPSVESKLCYSNCNMRCVALVDACYVLVGRCNDCVPTYKKLLLDNDCVNMAFFC